MINQFLRINKAKQRNIKAVELWNIRYEYLWYVYDHVWENELKYVKDFFNKNEFEKFCQLNDKFKLIDRDISRNPFLDNRQLNKLKTALKNLVLFTYKKSSKYEATGFPFSVRYCSKSKKITFTNRDLHLKFW